MFRELQAIPPEQANPEMVRDAERGPAHLHAVGRGLPELGPVGPQRVRSEHVGLLAPHVPELLEQLRLVLGEVEGLHGALGRVAHHGDPHCGHLATAAAEPLHLADSVQDGVHLGLEALLGHEDILISGAIKPEDHVQIAGCKGKSRR